MAEQVANLRVQVEAGARSVDTRSNRALADAAFALLRDRIVPSDPRGVLERFEVFVPEITPARVLAALKREAVPIVRPLIRFQGSRAPLGGAKALRAAWRKGTQDSGTEAIPAAVDGFGYTDFGPEGIVAIDTAGPLGIRELRFANGVMLNLKHTAIERDRILVKVRIDGGAKLDTLADPLATAMFGSLALGGLGKHSEDALQSILAGHTLGTSIIAGGDGFVLGGLTTPADLALQLGLLAAYVTDAGYRPEGEVQYRAQINNFFASKDATPRSALQNAIGGILSEDDPRFTLQPVEAYRKLTYAGLRQAVSDRLMHGAIEIAIVGDVDEAKAIGLVAKTFGALARREAGFRDYSEQPARRFTLNRARRVIRHGGPPDQALLRLTWPTRDDADPVAALEFELLEKVVRIKLTETLREQLGKAYSPAAASVLSHDWRGYGTFAIAASIDVHELAGARAAILETVRTLRAGPIDADLLQRARQPLLEAFDNALKTNSGWLALVDRAQTEPDRIARFEQAKATLTALTPSNVLTAAQRYLDPAGALEVVTLPRGVAPADAP